MSNERAPERIYLQDWADPITWCVDRIDADLSDDELDTEYVRLDLYAALEQERDKLRRVSEARYETEHAAANRWQEISTEAEQERDRYYRALEYMKIEVANGCTDDLYRDICDALEGGKE